MDNTEAWARKNFKWWTMPFVDVMVAVSMLPKNGLGGRLDA